MDPDQALADIRKLVTRILDASLDGERDTIDFQADATELAEKFDALDEWVSNAGFLPVDWLLAGDWRRV